MAAYLTTGTRTVSSPAAIGCELALLLSMLWFSLYDIRYKRVPNKALVLFMPVFVLAPIVAMLPIQSELDFWMRAAPVLIHSFVGAATGLGILLVATLLSKNGAGVGGGDIKLAAAMGFAYGAGEMLFILLIASLLCIPVAAVSRRTKQGQALSLPFVPFMAFGCLVVAGIRIFS